KSDSWGALSGRINFTGGTVVLMLVSAMTLLVATGCPKNSSSEPVAKGSKLFEGLKLKLAGADASVIQAFGSRARGWATRTGAIPVAGEGAVLVVRGDLLKDAALAEKYLTKFGRPLPSLPATWEDLAEIAEASADLHKMALPARSEEDRRTLGDFFRVAACYD